LYDLANTIFALGVVGLYFPAWVHHQGLADSALALTEAAAGVVVIFLAPFLGRRSDHRGRRLPTLAAVTAVSILATALLDWWAPAVTLLLLGTALVGFNLGSALYDALLDDVSNPATRARISGLGVAVGYLGSFVGLGLGILAFEVLDLGYRGTFGFLAAGFLIFSLPIFVFLRENRSPTPGSPPSLREVVGGLVRSWQRAASFPGVVRFLVGRFLYTDAINTLIGGFLAIFVLRELGLGTETVNRLLAVAIVAAIGGGLLGGSWARRRRPLPVLRRVLLLWAVAIGLGVIAAVAGEPGLIWLVGIAGGLALGMTWTADRVVMLELSPPPHLGEFYGLYATVGRFATVLGPLTWGLVVDALGWGRRVALGLLAAFVLAGWWVLGGIDDRRIR
jgi:UMF1 family MFS transporter